MNVSASDNFILKAFRKTFHKRSFNANYFFKNNEKSIKYVLKLFNFFCNKQFDWLNTQKKQFMLF